MRVSPFAALLVCIFALESPGMAEDSGLERLRAAARTSPGDPAAALALGRALRRAGQAGPALVALRGGVAAAATRRDVLSDLLREAARAHLDRRDFPQALATCKDLGKLGSAAGHACVADVHLVRQRAALALEETAAALAADPRCYEARVAEGRAYELSLEVPRAEASLREAVALRPAAAEGRVALGRVLRGEGKSADGAAELREAVRLDPDDPDALYELGLALAPGPESLGLLERVTRARPPWGEAWLALGTQQLAVGRVAEARASADAAVRALPAAVAARVLAGRVALAEGRADDAIAAGDAALEIVGNSAAAKLLVADGKARRGDLDAALETYQVAWGFDHGDPTPLVHAGEACHAAGRDTSARAFGVKATQEFPRWAPAWVVLGDALAARGEGPAARDAYRSALSAPDGVIDRAAVKGKLAALQ